MDAHPPTTIGGNSCEYDPLYEGALTAITMATLAQDAAEGADDAEVAACEDAAKVIKLQLYSNKRDLSSGNPYPRDFHGYLGRVIEQVCGALLPTSTGWNNHARVLEIQKDKIAENVRIFNENECLLGDYLSLEEKNMIEDIRNTSSKWHHENTPHLGRNHPLCEDAESLVSSGAVGAMISRI